MKTLFFLIALSLSADLSAQIWKRKVDEAKESLKRKTEQKVDQKIENGIDKGLETGDSVITGRKKLSKKDKKKNSNMEAGENNAPQTGEASQTVVTEAGAVFTGKKLTYTDIVYSDENSDFTPNPNERLNAVGAGLKQQLKTKKVLIRIYQRTSGDNAAKAEEEYMAMRMYLVNRYDLNEDRIYFHTPAAKKAGANRTVDFILVPDTFMDTDAAKF